MDRFEPPRTLWGWIRRHDLAGDGSDIVLALWINGQLVGESRPELYRPDVAPPEHYRAGFRLCCAEPIPDAALAFGFVRLEARAPGVETVSIALDSGLADAARARLQADLPLGAAAAAILTCLSADPALPPAAVAALHRCADRLAGQPVAPLPRQSLSDDSAVMNQFQSLGHDCRIGGVQRAFGAEPLGLLRFSGISIESVTTALRDRCRGIGGPDYTRLELRGGEYMSFDTRYGMASHTFLREGDIDRDAFYAQLCRRQAYLARNLLEDIEDGEKILVVHALPGEIADHALHMLRDAIRAIGPAPLLYLRTADAVHAPGTVIRGPDGLLVGHVPLVEKDPMYGPQAEKEIWLTVCRRALAMVRSQAAMADGR